jgi:hypothetical protein
MSNFISEEKQVLITDLLLSGLSIRKVMTLSGVSKQTINTYRNSLTLPPCKCGQTMNHKGWCQWRVENSEARQAWLIRATTPMHKRPACFFLGFMRDNGPEFEIIKTPKCSVRACVHPALRGVGNYCYQHNHFFDFPISMTDNQIDPDDMFRPSRPTLPYVLAAEFPTNIASLEKSLKFERTQTGIHRTPDNRHRNLGSDLLTYSAATSNAGRKGHSHKKIRKQIRLRGAGWKGNHPAQKPMDRFTRDSLDALPFEVNEHIEAIANQLRVNNFATSNPDVR